MNEDCLTLLIGTAAAGKSHWEATHPAELPARAVEVTRQTHNRIAVSGRHDGDGEVDKALREPAGKVIETRFKRMRWRRTLFRAAAAAGVPAVACLVHTENEAAMRRRIGRARRRKGPGYGLWKRKEADRLMRQVIAHAGDLTALTCVDNEANPTVIARIDRRKSRGQQVTGEGTWAERVTVPVLDAWAAEGGRSPGVKRIHALASIHETSVLGTGVRAGRHCEIGRYCRIGNRSRLSGHATMDERSVLGASSNLHRHAQIGRRCETGKGATVCESARLRDDCALGDASRVGERAVIESGTRIGNNVDIGAHCRVGERAVIESGTRIGNNAHIGAHCRIGAGCSIANATIVPDGTHLPPGTVLGTHR